jgi:thiol-disulfide isomerase/thioredoxin
MPIVITAIVVVGGLCLLDLLLTFGVIRRLREHTSMLTGARNSEPPIGLAAGKRPGAFSAVTTSGDEVTGAAGLRVVAFFSSWCSTCPERVPPFVEYLSAHHIERTSVLAVVAADDPTPAPYLEQLAEVALTCVEPTRGEIATAFQVAGFPVFFLLDVDGVVAVSGYDPATLPEPATV